MTSTPENRQVRRKAATRASIAAAANRLFEDKGFEATSIVDISEAADVAVRTIYLHFDSKAAILLSYFDDWLNELVDRLCSRPGDESLETMVTTALADMRAAGWQDNQSFEQMSRPHPLLNYLSSGSSEVAGHVMQSWVRAQQRLADYFRETADDDQGVLEPRFRAAAMFATWVSTVLSYQDEFDDKVHTAQPTHDVSVLAIRAFSRGLDRGLR